MCLMFNKCLNDSEQVNKIVYNELSFISIKIYILIAQTIEVYVSCSQVIFTSCARKPMLSTASLIPSIDTPSRVMWHLSRGCVEAIAPGVISRDHT